MKKYQTLSNFKKFLHYQQNFTVYKVPKLRYIIHQCFDILTFFIILWTYSLCTTERGMH